MMISKSCLFFAPMDASISFQGYGKNHATTMVCSTPKSNPIQQNLSPWYSFSLWVFFFVTRAVQTLGSLKINKLYTQSVLQPMVTWWLLGRRLLHHWLDLKGILWGVAFTYLWASIGCLVDVAYVWVSVWFRLWEVNTNIKLYLYIKYKYGYISLFNSSKVIQHINNYVNAKQKKFENICMSISQWS